MTTHSVLYINIVKPVTTAYSLSIHQIVQKVLLLFLQLIKMTLKLKELQFCFLNKHTLEKIKVRR